MKWKKKKVEHMFIGEGAFKWQLILENWNIFLDRSA